MVPLHSRETKPCGLEPRAVRCAIYARQSSEEGRGAAVQFFGGTAGIGRSVHFEPSGAGLEGIGTPLRGRRLHGRQSGTASAACSAGRY